MQWSCPEMLANPGAAEGCEPEYSRPEDGGLNASPGPVKLHRKDARLGELRALLEATRQTRAHVRTLNHELSELVRLLAESASSSPAYAELEASWLPPLERLLADLEEATEARLLAILSA
jgi:hypothetical protein